MLATLTYMSMRDLKIYYLTITLYVHVHFRIVYFAPHYGELHVLTTADGLFSECLGHSAKPLLHSAKALPSAALGKAFAECHVSTRQKKIRRQL